MRLIAAVGTLLAALLMLLLPLGLVSTPQPAQQTSACAPVTGPVADPGELSADKQRNAATIIAVAAQKGVGQRGAEIGLMTAMTESTMVNVNYGDKAGPDSRGLFQQRDPWGPLAVRMDPAGAAGLFYDALLKVDGWQNLDRHVAAQRVQRSAFSDGSNYARHAAWAVRYVGSNGTATCETTPVAVTASVSGAAGVAIQYALAQVGKPYIWGGTGPTGYDCSGLMWSAYRSAGVQIPRTAATQYDGLLRIPVTAVQPGDLVFNQPGVRGSFGHVAMVIPGGQVVVAPRSGKLIYVTTLDSYKPVAAARVSG